MKANQQFKSEEDAVSPVIGVILMVAITVVLAAVVFVLVSDLGGDSSVANFPQVKMSDAGTLLIDMEHRGGDCITLSEYTFRIGGTAASSITHSTSGASTFCVGDTITLDGGVAGTNEVSVIDKEAEAIVFERTIQLA